MDHYFTVHGGLKDGAVFFKFLAQGPDVNEIAVVGHGKGAAQMGSGKGLGINYI
jgi:hypothetical protein